MQLTRELMQQVLSVAVAAGREIMTIYRDEALWHLQHKKDDSPLTAADMAAHYCIEQGLRDLVPGTPVLSEESDDVPYEDRAGWSHFWLVDPLDGTREFVARNDEFSVNIALVDGHDAVLGVVYAPVTGVGYVAARGLGAWRVQGGEWTRLQSVALPAQGERALRLCESRRHRDPREDAFGAAVRASLGEISVKAAGSAFKICAVAEGTADAYPRLGPTMEWDTGAGQVVVEEAGGALLDDKGRPFRYNARPSLRNGSFIVLGSAPEKWLPCWLPLFVQQSGDNI